MGDRCYLTVEVHKDDRDKLVEFLREPNQEDDAGENLPHMLTLVWEEVNYAGYALVRYEELVEAAAAGVRFVATNSSGDNYPEGITVGHGGVEESCNAIQGAPVCEISTEDGEPKSGALEMVKRTVRLMKKVYGNE